MLLKLPDKVYRECNKDFSQRTCSDVLAEMREEEDVFDLSNYARNGFGGGYGGAGSGEFVSV